MRLLLLLISVILYSSIAYVDSIEIFRNHPKYKEFKDHIEKYKLDFSEDEIDHRFVIFLSNKEYIEQRNKQGLNFTLKMNSFGHLTRHEYLNMLKKSLKNYKSKKNHLLSALGDIEISDIDYRKLGVVSKVKDQGQCGSCWAFSTTGCLESQLLLKKISNVTLSEQQLVDCSSEYGNEGCSGGYMEGAFRYIKDHGISSDLEYRYNGVDNQCKNISSKPVLLVKDIFDIPSKDEVSLAQAVFSYGPVTVGIDAGSIDFQFYSSGIYQDDKCSEDELNHAVLVVGLGSEPTDYYIVKNSWGTQWGDVGFIKMARNTHNMCGIATGAVYATIEESEA